MILHLAEDLSNLLHSVFDLGNNINHKKRDDGENQFASSMGTQNCVLPHLQADYDQSFVCAIMDTSRHYSVSFSFMALLTGLGFLFQAQVTVPFADQYFNTVLSAYGPQAVVSNLTMCGSRIISHITYQFETNPNDESDSIQRTDT